MRRELREIKRASFFAAARGRPFFPVGAASAVFGTEDASDSWGREDPRIAHNADGGIYCMFHTAYNGIAIFLSLATSPSPTAAGGD